MLFSCMHGTIGTGLRGNSTEWTVDGDVSYVTGECPFTSYNLNTTKGVIKERDCTQLCFANAQCDHFSLSNGICYQNSWTGYCPLETMAKQQQQGERCGRIVNRTTRKFLTANPHLSPGGVDTLTEAVAKLTTIIDQLKSKLDGNLTFHLI